MKVEEKIKNNIIDKMKEVLNERDYNYTENALRTIVNKWEERKSDLLDVLSKHPLWNSEKMLIQFDQDYTREICVNEVYKFVGWLRENLGGYYYHVPSIFGITKDEQVRRTKIFAFIERIHNQFFDDSMDADINMINSLNELYHLRNNMKASKAIGKICRDEGWDKLPEYGKRYAALCDCLNPIKVKRHTCISLNPLDFLLMSYGTSWNSCHYIGDDFSDAGCYSAGTISYMLDKHSFIFYTVDASFDGKDIELERKIQREVFGYNDEVIAQLRLYPQSNDCGAEQVYDDIRAVVQKVISDCLDKPNLWIKSKKDVSTVIEHGNGATCYPDWRRGNPGHEHCSISTLKSRLDRPREIVFGARPICIDCGCSHTKEGKILCCDCDYDSDYYTCEHCGARLHEDDAYWCGDYTYCGDCVTYCEECSEYVPNDEIVKVDGRDICRSCREDSCTRCESCEEWHFDDNLWHTEDGFSYCDDCRHEHTFLCSECGDMFSNNDKNYDETTEQFYCDCCYHDIVGERELENEENLVTV